MKNDVIRELDAKRQELIERLNKTKATSRNFHERKLANQIYKRLGRIARTMYYLQNPDRIHEQKNWIELEMIMQERMNRGEPEDDYYD